MQIHEIEPSKLPTKAYVLAAPVGSTFEVLGIFTDDGSPRAFTVALEAGSAVAEMRRGVKLLRNVTGPALEDAFARAALTGAEII